MKTLKGIAIPAVAVILGLGCGSSESDDGPGGTAGIFGDASDDSSQGGTGATAGEAGSGGGTSGTAGTAGSGATAGTAGSGATAGTAGSGGTGGYPEAGPCVPSTCQGHTYQCGDCIDNDNDGLVDMQDPDCLGPCDGNEAGFDLLIPGGTGTAPCKLDCYFDQDTGSGNDECYWDHSCDPYSVAPNYYPQGSACSYTPGAVIPPTALTCEELELNQRQTCLDFCLPLVPNGCDCFGCCELPAESGNYVWLGSWDLESGSSKEGTCTLETQADPTKCHPCTPVEGCLNECGHCELCLGKTELPPDCYGTPPDGGTGGTAGAGGTGGSGGSGTGGTGGEPCGGQVCPPGSDPCGLWCQPPCPTGYFCLTGCCAKNPS